MHDVIIIIIIHRMRRLKDKNTIMTMVFKHVLPCQRTRCREDDVAVCMRKTDSRILTYQKLNNAHRIELPLVRDIDSSYSTYTVPFTVAPHYYVPRYYADSDITRSVVDSDFLPPGENANWACLNLLRTAMTILKKY